MILVLSAASAVAAPGARLSLGQPRFLPVDKAFQLSASWQGNKLSVRWYVSPGYYLYRRRLGFHSPNARLGKVSLPKPQMEQDPYFGKVGIYRDGLVVSVPVQQAGKSLTLEVRYQGCADAGYCYPPQKRSLNVAKLQ